MCTLTLAAVVTLVFAVIPSEITSKTVVFYPPPATSYIVYHTNVAGALARRGHEVWICIPDYLLQRNLVKDNSVKILAYGKQLGDVEKQIYEKTRIMDKFWAKEPTFGKETLYSTGAELIKIADVVLSDQVFVDKVRQLNPDLIVLESVPFNLNMIVLPYMLDIPFAFIGTIHDVVISKVPFSPAVTPFPINTSTDRMTFVQRLQNTILYLLRINFDLFYDSGLIAKFAPHKPYMSINDLATSAEVFIAEIDHILDYPRTTLPNTKLVGGSSASAAKQLEGEFKKFVDTAKTGIIVVSFGGSILDLPPNIVSKFISAFSKLDLGVVWKVNITSPDPKQILTSKWIPQNDLLGHEKTKLFVSHCGKNGQYEALYHGVPILCLPVYGDQSYNSERIKVKQYGLRADMREASADELAAMMKEIIDNGTYTENIKKASELYRELYKVPKEEAAYWLDHVMKYGGEYMRSPGQQMPWYQLLVLDVIAFLVAVIVVILLVIYFTVKRCYNLCRNKPRKIKSKRQ
ncbi:unnamed protein product [Candidula unifasciata]|uniref:UDP-glucuronosyltransferase n=1 Tax=Candidula unifasciata TaxID=100452 RepID=A0A8S3YNT5_9EUPU|nr:unnamed protein product [Candidula unifasciata]